MDTLLLITSKIINKFNWSSRTSKTGEREIRGETKLKNFQVAQKITGKKLCRECSKNFVQQFNVKSSEFAKRLCDRNHEFQIISREKMAKRTEKLNCVYDAKSYRRLCWNAGKTISQWYTIHCGIFKPMLITRFPLEYTNQPQGYFFNDFTFYTPLYRKHHRCMYPWQRQKCPT